MSGCHCLPSGPPDNASGAAPPTISDLRYDIGGVLFDVGAPIYISDLRYDIGSVQYDARPLFTISDVLFISMMSYIH